jgi:hypothetical protein
VRCGGARLFRLSGLSRWLRIRIVGAELEHEVAIEGEHRAGKVIREKARERVLPVTLEVALKLLDNGVNVDDLR